jgi:hypothetical protein
VVWEAIFFLLILKIPVVYLALVVWWAVRAKPAPGDGLEGAIVPVPAFDPRPGARWQRRPRRRGPGGGPVRTYTRRAPRAPSRVGT